MAEAYVQPEVAWPRLVLAGDRVAGFVMGAFEPDSEFDFFRCGIWRLNVAAEYQGRGVGAFAVTAVLDEARARGNTRATVLWVADHPASPEAFYLKLGFRPTGQVFYDQVVGAIELT